MLAAATQNQHALLIAPTGSGKTLAGFFPTLVELTNINWAGLHTLYVSPLKSLTQDIHRNLETPIADLDLSITVETRTGDTPQTKRQQQRRKPPNILLTTPESLALLLSYTMPTTFFATHAVLSLMKLPPGTKRGDQQLSARQDTKTITSLPTLAYRFVAWPNAIAA